MSYCNLCPRNCNVDRSVTRGFCGASDKIVAAKAYSHSWEEPCISGKNGSGTIFFSPCNMKCIFCQNHDISFDCKGIEITTERLSEIMLELQSSGVHNINLVTPTPYADLIAQSIRSLGDRLKIPVVYNCSGYESVKTIEQIADVIDIFIPDIKFKSADASKKYLHAVDYFEVALDAIETMIKVAGKPKFENDLLKSGVIVRHLVMPNYSKDSLQILDELSNRFGNDSFLLSLMSQYLPCTDLSNAKEIDRKVTSFEYNRVCDYAEKLGFDGYTQQRNSATSEYIPVFDNSGILPRKD